MAKRLKKIRVFVASPSDVREERDRLSRVIEELNRTVGPERAIIFEFVRWETHVTPGMGRAQEMINQQIGRYDIFIGIMWKWFGTPTGTANSGTEEEFTLAFASWKIARKPRIMFYFNQAKYLLNTPEEAEQVRRVLEFRVRLEKHGLIWKYNGPNDFEQAIRQHLQGAVKDLVTQSNKKKRSSDLETEESYFHEPVKELFANAFSEWRRHRVFASRDRLELFHQNSEKIDITYEQLRFILESWFKSREYDPENYVKIYDENIVVQICIDIIENEEDTDLINGAIKVIGNQDSIKCVEILLKVIEGRKKYQDINRKTAIERFWFSKVVNITHNRVPEVLVNVLRGESNFKLRKDAAYALHHYPTKNVIAALEEALHDSRSQVRFDVVNSLSSIKSPSSVEPLLSALEEERFSVKMRKKIVLALGSFKAAPKIRDILQMIAKDNQEDSQVVKEAKWSLTMLLEG